VSTTGRRSGLGTRATETPAATERPDGFTDEQWEVVQDAWRAGIETGEALGYRRGCEETHNKALDQWVATLSPDPRTPFIRTGLTQPVRVSDRKPLTAQQILAGARWSWRQVEQEIQRKTA
jgi:hypothetical protein